MLSCSKSQESKFPTNLIKLFGHIKRCPLPAIPSPFFFITFSTSTSEECNSVSPSDFAIQFRFSIFLYLFCLPFLLLHLPITLHYHQITHFSTPKIVSISFVEFIIIGDSIVRIQLFSFAISVISFVPVPVNS